MEKFSVLMAVYCKEDPSNFNIALESNLRIQSLKPDELVLICDGELTPELEKVISKWELAFPRIMKVFRMDHGGLGKALNFGLTKCSYSIVARSDSDDVCAKNRFEEQLRFMEDHPDIAIISSYIDEFSEDWTDPIHTKTLPLTNDELYKMAKVRNPLNHMAVMMRKDDVLRIGSYRHIPYIEDYELWVRAMINGLHLANVDKVLVHARTGNGMVKRRGTKKYIKSWHILNKEMIDAGMIGYALYVRNMIAITAFVYMPVGLKEFIYKKVLRKRM